MGVGMFEVITVGQSFGFKAGDFQFLHAVEFFVLLTLFFMIFEQRIHNFDGFGRIFGMEVIEVKLFFMGE